MTLTKQEKGLKHDTNNLSSIDTAALNRVVKVSKISVKDLNKLLSHGFKVILTGGLK